MLYSSTSLKVPINEMHGWRNNVKECVLLNIRVNAKRILIRQERGEGVHITAGRPAFQLTESRAQDGRQELAAICVAGKRLAPHPRSGGLVLVVFYLVSSV